MNSLPSLRRKLLRAFSMVVLLYAGLGAFLLITMLASSRTSPRMIHRNYDSIAAFAQMRQAWNAIDRPERFPEHSTPEWKEQFDKALSFELRNLTEPGEKEIATTLRQHWEKARAGQSPLPVTEFSEVNRLLDRLVGINEKGMFELAQENSELNDHVLIGATIYFLVTLLLAILLADRLSDRLSRSLKNIAEALHKKPAVGRHLKLMEPDNLELLILENELKHLWDRVAETERINVMEVLQQKTKLETVLESVEDGLLVIDSAGRISHCNACVLDIIGLPAEDVKGRAWTDLSTTNDNYLKLRASLHETIPESQELDLQLKSGTHHFSVRSRKISGPGGTAIGTLFLLQDITEKRQRERFRAEFIDLLSHELKTPLQSLGTASELLASEKQAMPAALQPFVETISEDVERIKAVANEFVQVTQSHSKVMRLQLEVMSLTHLLPEWIKPFRLTARDRGIALNYRQEGSPDILANLDVVKFPWAISNLLSNAIRFSPNEGVVDILLTDRNGAVEIQIKDQGPGISEEDQRRIFEPFFQAPIVTPSGKQGLFGIGLTIAKDVVEAHDGRIEYFPLKPHGSEFRILLPFPPNHYS